MDILVSDVLTTALTISITLSIIVMASIQKIKNTKILKNDLQILLANLILSFSIGIPFVLTFYQNNIVIAIWVSVFSFIGAPTIYEIMKKQNIINYKPKSLKNIIEIPIENYIKR